MTEERKSRFTVINNEEVTVNRQVLKSITGDSGYHTNPMYQKLLNYKQIQEKKKFTVFCRNTAFTYMVIHF